MVFDLNFNTITINTDWLKIFFIGVCTYYMSLKITNNEFRFTKFELFSIAYIAIIDVIVIFIRYNIDYFVSIIFLTFLLSILCSSKFNSNMVYAMLITIISLTINYILYFISLVVTFVINTIHTIKNDTINLIIAMAIQLALLYLINKIKRIKNGLSYLSKKSENNDYLDIIILNISAIILFSYEIFISPDVSIITSRSLGINIIIYVIMMVVTIQKSIQLYYKQKLLIKDLEDTKVELEKKDKEIQNLEKENIEISKRSHSLAHKQKSLEYKLNQLVAQAEIAEEISLKEKLDDISKELYVAPISQEIAKTDIQEIDDMLSCMQAECEENNIEFSLQINGNIHHMINNLISKEELEILIADHIKDAIIAINHSDNINRSILVKLGKIEDCYGLYIYDSGIEFEKETLENLGKKPITTHKDEGGTGMGFMNTFDTLKKHKASLIINEMGKPSKDNFTKVIMFKFDGKNEFKKLQIFV